MKGILILFTFFTAVKCFVPTEKFFPFGTENGQQKMLGSDDNSTAAQTLTIPLPFFDKIYPQLWVNVNGAISFFTTISSYTPACKAVPQAYSMISPFWADIDTRYPEYGDAVYFGESSTEKDLKQAESEVVMAFPNLYGIKLKSVFIVTWYHVTFYDSHNHPYEKRNTFQVAIATNGIYSFTIFYYNNITWTTGDVSGGSNGFGGTPAQAGFDAGDGKNRLMLDGSCTNNILTIQDRSNVNSPGKWIFRVDSANIETAGCSTTFLPGDILKISPSHVTTLGQVSIEVSGPCLKAFKTTVISCRIYDPAQPPYITVKGKIVGSQDSVKVICGIPYLFSVGRMKLELVITDALAPISFFNTTYYGYFYVTDLSPESDGLNLVVNKNANGTAETTTFTWNSTAFVNGTNFVDIQMIAFNLATTNPQIKYAIKIGEKVENSGKWIWDIHSNKNGENSFMSDICSNLETKIVFYAVEYGWDILGKVDYRSHWIANSGIDATKFIGDYCDATARALTCNEWYLSSENTSSSIFQSCPPTVEQASVDLSFILQPSLLTTFYHAGKDTCYVSITSFEHGEGQECCYKSGNIDCSFGGGHSQAVHSNDPFGHFASDILPWIMCCYGQDEGVCGKFQAKRPCDLGNNYIPPGPALALGDPHIHTFDNLLYTFNGYGEFWILRNSFSQPLSVQARMEPLDLTTTSATIFSGFVFVARKNSPKIQIQKSLIRIVDIFIDGQQLDITNPNSLRKLSLNGWQLIIADDYSEIQIGTNLGFSFKILTANGAFGISAFASPEWKTKTLGLFGNFNGNKSDDLATKNGTVIDPNSSLQQIHQNFGLSWAVTPETTLFNYFGDKKFADFNKFNYTPTFTFDTSVASNSMKDVCKNDWTCLFDYFYTNSKIANFTLFSNQNYENTVTILNKKIQMCSALIAPENGYANISNYLKGSTANFGCFTNYTINSNSSFICDNSYQWSPTNWNSVKCNYNFASNFSPSSIAFNFVVFCFALIFNSFVFLL